MKIIIAGGSGFIGSHISRSFKAHKPICLTRDLKSPYHWDPRKREVDEKIFQDVDVVINLAGEPVIGRWTKEKKKAIWQSRIDATEFLTELMEIYPPKLYIGASAIGYYGQRREEVLHEESAPGLGFLAELCKNLESIPKRVEKVRQVFARFGLILGADGGALKKMLPAFQLNLGAVLGSGRQRVSWMEIEDVCLAMQHIIFHPEIKGAVNFVSKECVTNREFTKTLAEVLHKKAPFRIPALLLKMALGSGASVLLSDLEVRPHLLEKTGYEFASPSLRQALEKNLSWGARPS